MMRISIVVHWGTFPTMFLAGCVAVWSETGIEAGETRISQKDGLEEIVLCKVLLAKEN